ncbi:MAG TPA: trehalose-6-phosphate synthase [Dehalococcoidia bacterium]
MSDSSIDAKLASLASVTEELLARRRLIIASNRGPLEHKLEPDGSLTAGRGSGGMVTALLATARFVPMTWVASAMTDGDRRAAVEAEGGTVKVPDYEIYVRFVTVPQPVYQRHYYVICNPLLWFIQHYMWNTPRTPNIGRVVYEAWDNGYIPTNQAIADAIIAEAEKEDEPSVVLLQDYHLYLAPKMVRERMPDATILHFTHIPWPGPRYWGMLPEFMRRGIHEHMAASDIIGLQTMSDVQNFLHSCDTMLDSEVDYHACTVDFEGHRTHVRAYPISVDAEGLLEFSKSEEVQQSMEKLRPLLGEKTILRVDRSEPSKNIIRGLRAYELLLERYPEFRSRVNFLQLLVPSRSDLGVYQTYTDEIFELVDSINDHFGEMDWQPIRVFYEDDYPQAIAAMTLYDVLLVNPVIDGMNLVSKEGPLVNQNDGVLILSELAGAYEQLQEHVLAVSPTDLEGTVRALHQALTMPDDERWRRAQALRQIVIDEDIIRWLEHQLSDLSALSRGAL